MEPLLRLLALLSLSDEDMVSVQRAALLDSTAPNPSVETLLHAWLPHKYVDHTHATPFLALADLPDVTAIRREVFGDRLALVPYLMPGFALAKQAAAVFDENPDCEGLLLGSHGHFTWGPDARPSYDRLISHTNLIEARLAGRHPAPLRPVAALPTKTVTDLLPILRGAMAANGGALPIFDLRATDVARIFLTRHDVADLALCGVATPDHVIRTKGHPLWLDAATIAGGADAVTDALQGFVTRYRAYFAPQAPRFGGTKTALSPVPGLVWIEGVGVMGVGADAASARIAADIGEQIVRVMADAQNIRSFHPISEADMFDCEYWSLEQAKLGKGTPPPLRGQVVLITGGAGAIGLATA